MSATKYENVECTLTPEVVCPYCGHEHSDSWEFGGGRDGEFEVTCHGCERRFTCSRVVDVNYTSHRGDRS